MLKNFNSENTATTAPDWYMYADAPREVKDYETVSKLIRYFEINPRENRTSERELQTLDKNVAV